MNTTTEAEATLSQFLTLFNAGTDVDAVVALFAADAQFWGTTMPEFGIGHDVIRGYFTSAFGRRGNAMVSASVTARTVQALSHDVVTILGRWQIARGDSISRLRFSVALHRNGGRWLIVQFHSSPRPAT